MALNHNTPHLRTPISGAKTLGERSEIPAAERLLQDRPATELDEDHSPLIRVRQSDVGYWKATLAGAPPLMELPTDRPRPYVMSYAGGRVAVVLTAGLNEGIRRLSQRHGTTLFMTLLSGWSILLSRLTRRSDIVIGTPVPKHQAGANTLPLRVRVTPEQRVADLLLNIKASTLEAYAHQNVPLMEIVDALNLPCDLSYHPIFQVMLAVDDRAIGVDDLADEQVKAKFDLTLALTDTGKCISGFLEYASDLFERSTIMVMAGQLQAVFETMIANDRQYLSAPNLLSHHGGQQPNSELASATKFMAATLQRRNTGLVAMPSSASAAAAVADVAVETIDGNAAGNVTVLGCIRRALERSGAIQDPLNAEEPVYLLIHLEGSTAVWHILRKRTTIGRTAENDVRIDAEFISRRHALVLRIGNDTVIEDLKSTNGTYVNGQRISRRVLKDGDVVALGTMEFHFSHNKPRGTDTAPE
jgi:hypothetical protein